MELHHDNGILAQVRGEDIGAASKQLPEAQPGQPETMAVEIDAAYVGRVRITFRLSVQKRRKSRYYWWAAVHAATL